MDLSTALQLIRDFGDTKFSLILAIVVTAWVFWKLRGQWERFVTKDELAAHKLMMYNESLVLEGSVSGTMQKIARSQAEHEEKDEKRFEAMDRAVVPQIKTIDDKVEKARRSLARIEGALNIQPEPETN